MSNFLIRAKALAYDIDQLMTDIRIMRNTLMNEQFHSEQAYEYWHSPHASDDYREANPEPKIIDNREYLTSLLIEYEALKTALPHIERVIAHEMPEPVELPDFLTSEDSQTMGQG